jgi:CheY-like chemotaxis protein
MSEKKILVADDDSSVRKMVTRVLETAGYAALAVPTGEEAVARFMAARPDLALLDLKAPDHTGWELYEQLSRLDPMVPVILLTAWPGQYEQAVQRGIDALMEKPLDLPLLLKTIQRLVSEPTALRARRLMESRRGGTRSIGTPG